MAYRNVDELRAVNQATPKTGDEKVLGAFKMVQRSGAHDITQGLLLV